MYKLRGKYIDIIEIFGDYLLVQEVESGKIYLTALHNIDECGKIETIEDKSNIISIDWARKWQRKTKPKKKK